MLIICFFIPFHQGILYKLTNFGRFYEFEYKFREFNYVRHLRDIEYFRVLVNDGCFEKLSEIDLMIKDIIE